MAVMPYLAASPPDAMRPQKPPTPANMYFIAHVLPSHLDEQILHMKKDLNQRFGCAVGLKSPAHITLVPPFWLAPDKEDRLIADVHQLANSLQPFSLSTVNFASFGKRTLFIAVNESNSLHQLKSLADDIFTGNEMYGLKKEHRPFHPHITLATRDIKPADFLAAWALYGHRQFEHGWKAEGVSLLRHNGKHWEVIETAGLNGVSGHSTTENH